MIDSAEEKALLFEIFIFLFTLLSAIWTSISCGGWIVKKVRPPAPEDVQNFGGKEALMLEELYEDMMFRKNVQQYIEKN